MFPGPDATRAKIDRWVLEAGPGPARKTIEHEAPPVENGPSLVCNACGVVRVKLTTPFCKGCMAAIDLAGAGGAGC